MISARFHSLAIGDGLIIEGDFFPIMAAYFQGNEFKIDIFCYDTDDTIKGLTLNDFEGDDVLPGLQQAKVIKNSCPGLKKAIALREASSLHEKANGDY